MLKPILPIFLFTLMLSACGQTEKPSAANEPKETEKQAPETEDKTENALKFINGYVDNAMKMAEAVEMTEWVNSSGLVTPKFKAELKRIIDEAYESDPEMGLDFDPILDAQDFPEKGFEFVSIDETNNLITVKGKDWPDFVVVLKVATEKDQWLVDGCGIVNLPEDQRAER